MPILTLDSIFPNGEGLKNVEKLILKRKSIIEEVFIFQDTQEEDVAPFTPKMKQPWKKLASKKMVKAKEGKEHRDEESKKNWKACNVEALIAFHKMAVEFAQNAKKHVRFQSLQCLLAHIVHLEFLQGKSNFQIQIWNF